MLKYVKPVRLAVLSLIASSLLFVSCKKETVAEGNNPVAAFLAFNLAADNPPTGFALSGNVVSNSPLAFSNYSGAYLSIFPGSRSVESFNYFTRLTLANSSFDFVPNKYYSAFLVGTAGNYANVVVEDKLDTLAAVNGKAYIRFINAVPDSSAPRVKISSAGTEILNVPSAYKTVSEFVQVPAGDIMVTASNEGSVNTSRTLTVEASRVYTLLVVGTPSATDPALAPQIKFISNGTITP